MYLELHLFLKNIFKIIFKANLVYLNKQGVRPGRGSGPGSGSGPRPEREHMLAFCRIEVIFSSGNWGSKNIFDTFFRKNFFSNLYENNFLQYIVYIYICSSQARSRPTFTL